MGDPIAAVAAETEELAEAGAARDQGRVRGPAGRHGRVRGDEAGRAEDPRQGPLGRERDRDQEQHRLHAHGRRGRRGQGVQGRRRRRARGVRPAEGLPRADGDEVVRRAPGAERRAHGVADDAVDPQRAHHPRPDLRHPAFEDRRAPGADRRDVRVEHPDEHADSDLRRAGAQERPAGEAHADARRGHARALALRLPDRPRVRGEEGRDAPRREDGGHGRHRRAQHPGLLVPRRDGRLARVALPPAEHPLPRHGRVHEQGAVLRDAGLREPAGHVRRRAADGHAGREARHGPDRAAEEELRRPRRHVLGPGAAGEVGRAQRRGSAVARRGCEADRLAEAQRLLQRTPGASVAALAMARGFHTSSRRSAAAGRRDRLLGRAREGQRRRLGRRRDRADGPRRRHARSDRQARRRGAVRAVRQGERRRGRDDDDGLRLRDPRDARRLRRRRGCGEGREHRPQGHPRDGGQVHEHVRRRARPQARSRAWPGRRLRAVDPRPQDDV